MSIDVDRVMRHFRAGHKLVYSSHPIAEIISVSNPLIEIKDIHGKRWFVNQDHLADLSYPEFLSNLASVIAQHCPENAFEGSARQTLMAMKLGDTLENTEGYIASLVEVKPNSGKGPILTFRDVNEMRRKVYPHLLQDDLTYNDFVSQFQGKIRAAQATSEEPVLSRYFKNEFIPKMLSQMDYDNLRWGDTWLMQSVESQEKNIQEHFNHYFEYYRLYGKKVPWLKIAGYAIIAQAREDHPEWLL